MRYARTMSLFALFSGFCAAGQVHPASNGSCTVSPSGVMGCQWMSGVKGSKLFVTRYKLAPGAPLSTPVDGQDAVIVGINSGELSNEKKSPPSHVNVSDGSVILMPKEEPYLLRNVGKESVDLLLIEVRK
jgi:mannose-6-phosphate isomerase-like protein (cupin superfamily)